MNKIRWHQKFTDSYIRFPLHLCRSNIKLGQLMIRGNCFIRPLQDCFWSYIGIFTFCLTLLSPNVYATDISENDKRKSRVNILVIDGGGIRGIMPARILEHIERRLNAHFNTEEGEEIRIADCFDLIAGTSTGGIIALGTALSSDGKRAQYPASEMVKLYQDFGGNIFPKKSTIHDVIRGTSLLSKKHSSKPLEKKLEEYFGDKTLNDTLNDVFITSYNLATCEPYFFDSHRVKMKRDRDFFLKDVARATSAAPTFFNAATFSDKKGNGTYYFVDGGVVTNDPTLHAFMKARIRYPNAKEFFILSLGTGVAEKESLTGLKRAGELEWAQKIHSVMMDGATYLTGKLLDQISSSEKNFKVNYKRVQTNLPLVNMNMDDATERNLQVLLGKADSRWRNGQDSEEILKTLTDYLVVEGHLDTPLPSFYNQVTYSKKSYLSLRGTNIHKLQDGELRSLFSLIEDNSMIGTINISNNNIGADGNNGIKAITDFFRDNPKRKIKKIVLSGNILKDTHIGYITQHFPDQKELVYSDNNGRGRGQLGILDLRNIKFSSQQVTEFGAFAYNKGFFKIYVSSKGFNKNEVKSLSRNPRISIDGEVIRPKSLESLGLPSLPDRPRSKSASDSWEKVKNPSNKPKKASSLNSRIAELSTEVWEEIAIQQSELIVKMNALIGIWGEDCLDARNVLRRYIQLKNPTASQVVLQKQLLLSMGFKEEVGFGKC